MRKSATGSLTPRLSEVASELVIPEGIVEDVMVSINSLEYPVDFLVLQPKAKLVGYPLILGRPWLATADAYIRCRAGNMTIKNGHISK